MRATAVLLGILVCLGGAAIGRADDWPQWLGPQRDSVWRETGIVSRFPATGLPVKWRASVAGGYAGPAVAQGKVYLADYLRTEGDATNSPGLRAESTGQERLLCLAADSGKLLWKFEYPVKYRLSYPAGPRVTPTVSGGKVFTLGAMGRLCCLDAATGALVWSKELTQEYQTETPIWGFAGHPLVDGQKLICLVGGSGSVAVALDKDSGKELWRALSAAEPGYCPPTIIEAGGTRQLIIWHAQAINGLHPETGEVYWSIDLEPSYGMSIATPRQSGDYLFASGVQAAAALVKLDRQQPKAELVWRGDNQTAVYCANSSPVIVDGVLYGVCHKGELRGVELATGKRLWETPAATSGVPRTNYGTAFLIRHEDRFFLFNELGDLILAQLTPEGYQEISRFHVLEPTNETFGRPVVWSHPAFAERCLFARNDKELVCVSLAE